MASYLLFTELSKALTSEIRSQLVFSNLQVGRPHQISEIPIELDLDLPNAPCELVDLRALATRNSVFRVLKFHLHPDNRTEEFRELMGDQRLVEQIKTDLGRGVGCRLKGWFSLLLFSEQFLVQMVQGPLLFMLREDPSVYLDYSHRINSLLVGEVGSHEYYERYTPLSSKYQIDSFNKLGGHSTNDSQPAANASSPGRLQLHMYFLKVEVREAVRAYFLRREPAVLLGADLPVLCAALRQRVSGGSVR